MRPRFAEESRADAASISQCMSLLLLSSVTLHLGVRIDGLYLSNEMIHYLNDFSSSCRFIWVVQETF